VAFFIPYVSTKVIIPELATSDQTNQLSSYVRKNYSIESEAERTQAMSPSDNLDSHLPLHSQCAIETCLHATGG